MTRPEDLDDHALLRFLEERAFGLVGTERVLLEALAACVAESVAPSPPLRDLAEGLLEQLQNNRRRAVRAPSGPTEG